MTITVNNGAAIRTPQGSIYVNFSIIWGLNGTFGAIAPDSMVPAPQVSLDVNGVMDARSFGVVRGVMVDNTKCRSPLLLLSYSTGWTAVCKPLRTTIINVDSNTTGLLITAPGGTMSTDVTNVTLGNARAGARTFGPLDIPGQHAQNKVYWWNQTIDMSAAASTTHLFAGDAIVDYMDVDINGLTVTGGGAATLAFVSRQASVGTLLTLPITFSATAGASGIALSKWFKLRTPLYCTGGVDAVWANAASVVGKLALYGNFL